MVQRELAYEGNIISYVTYGTGSTPVVCLHGYAQNATRWSILEPFLKDRFTLYAFDLPYHGRTQWKNVETFTVAAFVDIIKQVLLPGAKTFYLLAYSMGGRIALGLLQAIPQMIAKVVLLAPDGLHGNPWYRFATHTRAGRALFNECKKNPKLIISVGKQLRKRGILSEQMYNLAHYYINDETARFTLYDRWISTRHFDPSLSKLRAIILRQHTPVDMIFAKHDKIILASRGTAFAKGVESYVHIHVIDAGHSFLYAPHAAYIASFFSEVK